MAEITFKGTTIHTCGNSEGLRPRGAGAEIAYNHVYRMGLDGVVSTFALTLVPEYAQVIRNAVSALVPGGRFVILDLARYANLHRKSPFSLERGL